MRRRKELDKDESGNTLMTKHTLKTICENEDLYEHADLNDKLYLQFKGFLRIENLDEYENLKAIWLNNNGISKIENFTHQTQLVSLFLNNNLIPRLENISHLHNLLQLNLSHNRISRIENLSSLTRLNSLILSFNILQDYDSLVGVLECPSLTNIDLTSNLIEHDDAIIDIFIQMPVLACLYLKGNPCVREFKNYRKRLIGFVSTLKFLDDRPVQTDERRVSEAWIRDGRDGEQSEREAIMKERDQKNLRNYEEMIVMQEEIIKKRKVFYQRQKEVYRQSIEKISKVIEQCKAQNKGEMYLEILTSDLASEKTKLAELEANQDTLSVADPPKEVRSFSSTTNPDGSVSIWNKSSKEMEEIRSRFIDNPDVQKTRTSAEIEQERFELREAARLAQMREDEKRIELQKKQEEIEEDERRQREFIDYSKQWKTFMLADKEKEERENQEKQELREMANPQMNIKRLRVRWLEGDFDELLENLLLRYVFDFEHTSVEFNKIAVEVMKGLSKPFLPFSAEDLRMIWTYLEVNKFRKSKEGEASIGVKSDPVVMAPTQKAPPTPEELERQREIQRKKDEEKQKMERVMSEIQEMKSQVVVSDEITSWETIEQNQNTVTASSDVAQSTRKPPVAPQQQQVVPELEPVDLNDLD